jgi:hypothetical protein
MVSALIGLGFRITVGTCDAAPSIQHLGPNGNDLGQMLMKTKSIRCNEQK